ncbi:MAG: hypothetical protein FWE84_01535 [Firmicutes bacterium]|nr:hypothetical protein [Bacillota bacterium]
MKTKRLSAFILLVCVFAVGVFLLSACGNDLPDNTEGVTIRLIVLDGEGAELYNKEQLTYKSALADAFIEFEGLNVKGTSSYLGLFITSVEIGTLMLIEDSEWGNYEMFVADKTLEPAGYDEFIAVYHDIDDINYKWIPIATYAHDGKTFFSSGLGVSFLPLFDGATYMLTLETYGG